MSGDPEPDGLRPYTPGTPINRVHWAGAARGGELQERHFATGRDQLPLVVVDTQGADAAAVAWVARSAAGLVLALARAGGCRVLLPGDRVVTTIDDVGAWPPIHRRLAALEPDGATMPVHDPEALFVRAASAPERADRAAGALAARRRRAAHGVGGRVQRGAGTAPRRSRVRLRGRSPAGGRCSAAGLLWSVPIVAAACLVMARAIPARAGALLLAAWVPVSLLLAGVSPGALRPRELGGSASSSATAPTRSPPRPEAASSTTRGRWPPRCSSRGATWMIAALLPPRDNAPSLTALPILVLPDARAPSGSRARRRTPPGTARCCSPGSCCG